MRLSISSNLQEISDISLTILHIWTYAAPLELYKFPLYINVPVFSNFQKNIISGNVLDQIWSLHINLFSTYKSVGHCRQDNDIIWDLPLEMSFPTLSNFCP